MDESLKTILEATEGEHYEFKTAANRFSVDELLKYACAFANCGGGKIVFGVSDERPRQIIGTKAFEQPERVCAHLIDKLKLRIGVQTFNGDGKPVIMFSIPQRPIGVPIEIDGRYWTRRGDSLTIMPADELRSILAELSTDDFLLINRIKEDKKVPEPLQNRIARLLEFGILEKIGRGKFILSKRYYTAIGKKGVYTRKKGLERAEIKALLVKHIRSCGAEGSPLRELCDVLPSRSESQIRVLLRQLRKEKAIVLLGNTKAGRWFIAESTEN